MHSAAQHGRARQRSGGTWQAEANHQQPSRRGAAAWRPVPVDRAAAPRALRPAAAAQQQLRQRRLAAPTAPRDSLGFSRGCQTLKALAAPTGKLGKRLRSWASGRPRSTRLKLSGSPAAARGGGASERCAARGPTAAACQTRQAGRAPRCGNCLWQPGGARRRGAWAAAAAPRTAHQSRRQGHRRQRPAPPPAPHPGAAPPPSGAWRPPDPGGRVPGRQACEAAQCGCWPSPQMAVGAQAVLCWEAAPRVPATPAPPCPWPRLPAARHAPRRAHRQALRRSRLGRRQLRLGAVAGQPVRGLGRIAAIGRHVALALEHDAAVGVHPLHAADRVHVARGRGGVQAEPLAPAQQHVPARGAEARAGARREGCRSGGDGNAGHCAWWLGAGARGRRRGAAARAHAPPGAGPCACCCTGPHRLS